MSYISTEEVKNIRETLKKEFPQIKFSVTCEHNSSVNICIMKSPFDLNTNHSSLNPYYPTKKYGEDFYNTLVRIIEIAKGQGWYDRSDIMTDYFDTAYYIDINIGKWNKPYICSSKELVA